MTVLDLTSLPAPGRKTVLLFWAPWQEESAPGGTCDAVLQALAPTASDLVFGRVQAEAHASVAKHYAITAVPTFLCLNANGTEVERVEGSQDMAAVTRAVQTLMALSSDENVTSNSTAANSNNQHDRLQKRLHTLTHSHPVMIFIKGTPEAPRCGFSRQAVTLLQEADIAFGSFDILQDEEVRQELKTFSNWPTYPQLYVNGELQGGLDIMKELAEEGSLKEQLGISSMSPTPAPSLHQRLKQLITQQRIMIFMKGLPSAPKCGFSRQLVEILNNLGVDYGAFDILADEEVRQGLKEYSQWPTYPQLYCNGELIGGLDIVKELAEDGSLLDTLK